LDFGNGKLLTAKGWKTFILDSDYMLKDFAEKLKKNPNANFIEKNFDSVDDVLKIPNNVIFNCLGVSSG
jgi:hypothetical protein